jgi:glutamate dehydrogenase (NAD(P)+)
MDLFRFADDIGPTKIIHVHEPSIGLKAVLVVDNVAMGPSIGGLRMALDVSTEECVRLARAMTLKNAAAGLRHGGGKSVLVGDPMMPREEKEPLIRGLACALRDIEEYIIGPDMGTNEECMAWAHDEIGRAVGLPRELGGIPLDEIGATGWGLLHSIEAALPYCDFELAGARVVVQGFGAVGMHAARYLADKGAVLVAACDSRGGVRDDAGLSIADLVKLRDEGRSACDYGGGERIERDAVIDVPCDIWIPAARPDVVDESNVDRLRTKLVAQGANIPITVAAERKLHERGVLSIPDFIANAGGVICAAMEYQKATEAMAMQTIAEKIRRNTEEVLAAARRDAVPPRDAARDLALRRVRRAMEVRRWAVF